MKTKLLARIGAAGAGLLMTAGLILPSAPVMAANAYTPVAGTSTTFQKYLVMERGARTPGVSFSYSVAAGRARSADTHDNTVMDVIPGPNPQNVRVTNSVFSADQTTYQTASASQIDVQRTDRTETKWEANKGEKFAVSASTVDFSRVTFPEPGIYRYIITENAASADTEKGIMHDEDADRVLDVYITDENGALKVSSYVLHMVDGDVRINATSGSADAASAGTAVADKTDGFTNEFYSTDLAIANEVRGNQGSRDKYFKYHVKITGLTPGDQYTISYGSDNDSNTKDGNADLTINPNPNQATTCITSKVTQPQNALVPTGGVYEQDFYLQHNQSFVIRGLPQDAVYEVTEDKEDYKATASIMNGFKDPVNGKISTVLTNKNAPKGNDVDTSWTNQKQGVIPTGILFSILPGIVILIAGTAGIVLLARKKRAKEQA